MAKLELTKKQREAWTCLHDKTTMEVLFGGGAGGAKTYLGCAWIASSAIRYPGTRWVIGRAVLRRLKETTLKTLLGLLREWGLERDSAWHLNSMDNIMTFANGSEILFKDLYAYPSDPEFDSLGSLEITGAFVDEANQITHKAKSILLSRVRYKIDEYELMPKVLFCCNPSKNWTYSEFYNPEKEGKLLPHRKYIQALAKDNPFLPKSYIQALEALPKNSRERLLYGNWEYDDDPSKLFDIEVIHDLFTNKAEASDEKYISVDVARFGDDKSVLVVWTGYKAEIHWKAKADTREVAQWIVNMAETKGVRRSNIVIDEDGVGGGVLDQISGAKGFLNGSKAIQPRDSEFDDTLKVNYANLKTQCYFEFAKKATDGKIEIDCDETVKPLLIADLEQIKEKNIDKDGKVQLIGKDEIKKELGRSPDFSDAMAMRFLFDVQQTVTVFFDSF